MEVLIGVIILLAAYGVSATLAFFKQRNKLKRLLHSNTEGKIIIDHSDPDGPYVFLQLDAGISELSRRELLYLEVDNQGLTRD